MNLNHLTDMELINYTLRHDQDAVRVRLASIMERMPGCIIDSLEDAGMDDVTCLFENTYDPGQYIRHLQSEIEFLNEENHKIQEKLRELETMTVLNFMEVARKKIEAEQRHAKLLAEDLRRAVDEKDHMKSKLSMWTKLNGQGL
jgi:Skp family chaperone for outer membrane proteins